MQRKPEVIDMSRNEASLTAQALEDLAKNENRIDQDDLTRVSRLLVHIRDAMSDVRLAEFEYLGILDGADEEDLIDELGDNFMAVMRDPLIDAVIEEALEYASMHDTFDPPAVELNALFREIAKQALTALRTSEQV